MKGKIHTWKAEILVLENVACNTTVSFFITLQTGVDVGYICISHLLLKMKVNYPVKNGKELSVSVIS